MNDTSASSEVFDPKTALRFFLALFKGAPENAVFVLQHGETTHLLGQRAPMPLDILATAAQARERITFSPALREARDPQAITATPVVWVHVRTDLPTASVLGQLRALRPAAVVRADQGVDIYWKAGLAPEDAPAAMESLAAALGGSVTPTRALRPVPLRAADVALDPEASAIHYDAMTAAIALLPRLTPCATVVAHVSTDAAQSVASEHPAKPDDAAGLDVAVSTARFEGDTARAPFGGSRTSADEATGPRPFPEAAALVRALAEAEELPLEQAWVLWAVREAQRQFGKRFTLEQLNVDSVLLVNGHLVVRRGHRYFGVRHAEGETFDLEPIV